MDNNYYNSNYKLQYYEIPNIEESDTQYRKEFLTVFNLKKYDETKIDKAMTILYNKLKNNQSFKNIFESASLQKQLSWLINDDISKLYILFNFDMFFLVHNCISDYFKYQDITEENYNIIMSKLNN